MIKNWQLRPKIPLVFLVFLKVFTAFSWDAQTGYADEDPFASLTDEQAEELIRLLNTAESAEANGEWELAANNYGAMWEILPVEEYRYRQAHCLEQIGDFRQALDLYRELAQSDRTVISRNTAARANVLEHLVANLPAQLLVRAEPPGAELSVDAQRPTPIPPAGLQLELPSGEHRMVVQVAGHQSWEEVLTLTAGENRELSLILEPLLHEELVETSSEFPFVPVLLGGTAVAAGISGVVFAVLSSSRAESERNYDLWAEGASREEMEQLAADAETFGLIANLCLISAGALAVTAVVVWLLDDGGEEPVAEAGDVAILPFVQHSTVGAVWRWSF